MSAVICVLLVVTASASVYTIVMSCRTERMRQARHDEMMRHFGGSGTDV